MLRRTLTATALAGLLLLPATLLRADDPPKGDKDLDGVWEQQSLVRDGTAVPAADSATVFTVKGDSVYLAMGGTTSKGAIKVDVTKTPKTIDLTPEDGPGKNMAMKGVYEVKGDELRICFGDPSKGRPAELSSKEGSGSILITFKRAKK